MNKIIESTREAFIAAMFELADKDRKYVIVSADSMKAMRATQYQEKYPERLFEVGIAEQNSVAFAAGLASCGMVPFVCTYAGFLTMRACEQMRTFVAYPALNVKFVGLNGGLLGGEREGVTHQFFEDLGILRSMPGFTIFTPSDASQTRKAVLAAADYDGPVYIRIASGREFVALDQRLPFIPGKGRILVNNGNDAVIFAAGFLMTRVFEAAEVMKNMGINVTIAEIGTLKPLDIDFIAELCEKTGAAVTVEDHNIIGGLGSAVAEVIAEKAPASLSRIGLRDVFPVSGEVSALLDRYEMGVNDIVNAVVSSIKKKEACGHNK